MVNTLNRFSRGGKGEGASVVQERWLRRFARALRANAGTLVALALLLGASWTAHRFLTTSPLFTISRVVISGGERTPPEDFAHVARMARGQNLFTLDIEALRAVAERHPWAREAVVYRVAPNGVRVSLREPVPTAIVERGAALLWLDERGDVIEPVGEADLARGVSVPLLVGVSGGGAEREAIAAEGAAALDALRSADPDFYERVAALDAGRDDRFVVRLKDYDAPLYLHREFVTRNLDNLAAVWGNLAPRHGGARYVDLRWKNQIVVMPLSGGAAGGGLAASPVHETNMEPLF